MPFKNDKPFAVTVHGQSVEPGESIALPGDPTPKPKTKPVAKAAPEPQEAES